MPFSFFKMSASQKPTGAYSRPRTGSSYTSTKIYKTDERGRRVVAGTRVGRYDKRQDRIVYDYRPVVERKKPTMSNFLASLFKPAIDRKIAGSIATATKSLGARVTERDEVEIDISDIGKGTPKKLTTVKPTPDFYALQQERKRKVAEEREATKRRLGLIGDGNTIDNRINITTAPSILGGLGVDLNITDLRFNRGR